MGLIWVQTVLNGFQQRTPVGKNLALATCIYPVLKSVERDELAVLHPVCEYMPIMGILHVN